MKLFYVKIKAKESKEHAYDPYHLRKKGGLELETSLLIEWNY